jgi:predicted TIM-barrel fold metal-dependent hydrolase
MIIDTHAHIIDGFRGYIGRGDVTSAGLGRLRYGTGEVHRTMPPGFIDTTFRAEVFLEYMADARVDQALLMQATYYGLLNDYVSSAVNQWPDRFVGVACLDPYAKYRQKILAHCVEDLGLRAVKFEMSEDYGLTGIHPDLRLNAPELESFFSQLEGYGIPFIIDPGWSYEKGNRPGDLREVINAHPRLVTVVCHLGQPTHSVIKAVTDRASADPTTLEAADFAVDDDSLTAWLSLAEFPNVYYDLSIVHLFAEYEEYPYTAAQAYVRYARARVGADRLMWASDVPSGLMHGTYEQLVNWVRRHCGFFSDAERQLVLGQTAHRVFKFKDV